MPNASPRPLSPTARAAAALLAACAALGAAPGCALRGADAERDDLERLLGRGPDGPEPERPPASREDLRHIEAALASSRSLTAQAAPAGATEVAEPAPRAPLTLRAAVAQGEETLESLKLAGEDLHRAHIARISAMSEVLPTIAWHYTYFRSEPDVAAPSGVKIGGLITENRTSRFELRQPLFHGEDWGAIAAAGPFIEAAEARVREERRLVRVSVVRAFLLVQVQERVVATFEAALARDEERLKEARDRAAVGVVRRTEVLFIETDKARAQSQLVKAREDAAAARQRLSLAIGRPVEGPLAPVPGMAPPPAIAEPLVARALERRQDLDAARQDAVALRRALLSAYGRFLPGVDLVGNLYTHREGSLEDVDWDVSVDVNVPIFEGLSSGAALRDAQSQERQSRLRYEQLARSIAEEVTGLWHDRRASIAALESQRVGLASAEENYRLLEAEYRAGIATNLELVTAEQALRTARLDLEIENLNEKRLAIEVELATGGEP